MNHASIIIGVALGFTAALSAAPAYAQAYHTFVSPTGSDSNPCTLALPCRNLQAALTQTTPGGEIAILGTAGYSGSGTFTIDRAISVVNTDAYEARISPPSGGVGIVINAGASDAVSLRGLIIEGGGVGATGIQFNTGASLTVQNCVVRHMSASGNGGIYFAPIASSSLFVSHTVVSDNGYSGIYVQPTGSGTVSAVFNGVEANNNLLGITLYTDSAATIKVTATETVAAGNKSDGFFAEVGAGSGTITFMLDHVVAANNSFGVFANGTGVTVRLYHSMLAENASGWGADGGAVVQSYGNNSIDGNGGEETAPPSIALK